MYEWQYRFIYNSHFISIYLSIQKQNNKSILVITSLLTSIDFWMYSCSSFEINLCSLGESDAISSQITHQIQPDKPTNKNEI